MARLPRPWTSSGTEVHPRGEIKVCLSAQAPKKADDIIAAMRKWIPGTLLAVLLICLVGLIVYQLPFVHNRLAWRIQNAEARLYHALNPPQEAVFIPQQAQLESIVQATLQALASTPDTSPTPTITANPSEPTSTPTPSPTPPPSPTAIPTQALLSGLRHEYQQMNNCGPTTLAMALSYWGWQGDQRDTRRYLRPNFATVDDKNVSPAEMAAYVEKFTTLKALVRVGGDIDLLKRLIAGGFPVVVEKVSNRLRKTGWATTTS